MIELSSATTKHIEKIFHFADIHIRNGDLDRSRYDEYRRVMQRALDMMDKSAHVQEKSAVTVIAGDLFHHKGRMDTPALKLYFWWMDELLARTPVFVICGNHDFRQEDPKHPDMMETMVLPYMHKRTKHPLHYLNETGHYAYANVGFGVVSIKDTLKAGCTHGIVQNLPAFPPASAFADHVTHRFALFHGSITQSALPNDQRMSEMSGYPLDWFGEYKHILLGDNHKQQVHTHPCVWAYPGSLVQQDFGEPTSGHGFIEWALCENGEATPMVHHVYNEYGLITTKWSEKEQDHVVVLGRRDVLPISRAVVERAECFPTRPRVRVIGTVQDIAKVGESLAACNVRPEHIFAATTMETSPGSNDEGETAESSDIRIKMMQLSDLNSPQQWVDYLSKVAPDLDAKTWLVQPETIKLDALELEHADRFLPKDLMQKLIDRNARMQKAIDEYYEEVLHTHPVQHKIVLKHMSWDYAMCYGQGNYFDFEKIQNTVSLLNGKNAVGKSSFLDVLCIGLFGEPTKHRNMLSGKKMTAKMIHDQRPSHKSLMRVSILFVLNDHEYEISRSFTTQKKEEHGVYAQLHNASVCCVAPDRAKKTLVCEGSMAVEAWVGRHFGSIEDLLMSTIVCQMDMTNFFYLKQDEQKNILDHALNLGSIAAFGKVLKEAILAHTEWVSLLRTSLQTLQNTSSCGWITSDDIERIKDDVACLKREASEMDSTANNLLGRVGVIDELPDMDDKEAMKCKNKLVTKLAKYNDIHDDDMELSLMVKGEQMSRFEHLRDRLQQAHTDCGEAEVMDRTICKGDYDKVNTALEKHLMSEPKPSITREHIASMQKALKEWKRQYPNSWCEDPDALSEHVEDVKRDCAELEEAESMLLKKVVSKPTQPEPMDMILPEGFQYKSASKELKEVTQRVQQLQDQRVIPVRSKDGHAAWKKEWAQWQREIADVEHIDADAAELKARLDEYDAFVKERRARLVERRALERDICELDAELKELSGLPFNPECWACQKQPSVLRQQQVEKNRHRTKKVLTRILKYLDECDKHGTEEEAEEELDALQQQYEKRKYYERFVAKMKQEKEQWTLAEEQWVNEADIEKELCALKLKKAELESHVLAYEWSRWKKWQRAIDDVARKRKEVHRQLDEMQGFLKEYDAREKDMCAIQEQSDMWDTYDTWKEKEEDMRAHIDGLRRVETYWQVFDEFSQLEADIKQHGENIERIFAKKKLMEEMDVCDRVVMYNKWRALRAKSGEVQAMIDLKQKELTVFEAAQKEQEQHRERVEWMQERLQAWSERKADLQQLDSKFIGDKANGDGYKEWIYRERVVPLVTTEVNRFLETIETIKFKMAYDRKCFLYFIEDRGNTPTLDKASGYQNFVVGLAMRIALSRIGAVGQNVRHLFIDEGFTACDVVNIEKVPVLLQCIMNYGGYESILLMSHLEQVQDAASIKIDIERRGMFSFIKWGSLYPTMELEVPQEKENTASKRRGRPRKTD
jgi:DNA repair exonuclease SbcCD ATPase subunit/DNA repair exonuclease SbcCD nuclease subunit